MSLEKELREINIEQLEELPLFHRATIPESYLDTMGHMNIRWYMALFDNAGWKLFAALGMDQKYYNEEKGGGFALQQFITYLAEVRVEETIAVRIRLLGRSTKRIHFLRFMINETTGKLACTMEGSGAHADMKIRRTSPFPPHIAERIDSLLAEHRRLDWAAPVCGVISV